MPEIRVPGPDDYRDSKPSPYCGRLDDHPAHGKCPGPPTITRAEREAVEKSVRKAHGRD